VRRRGQQQERDAKSCKDGWAESKAHSSFSFPRAAELPTSGQLDPYWDHLTSGAETRPREVWRLPMTAMKVRTPVNIDIWESVSVQPPIQLV
jgi:hypothetical protein